MKILQINTVYPYGSTGKIVKGIQNLCKKNGHENVVACRFHERGNENEKCFAVSSYLDCHIHNRIALVTGLQGCFSYFHTLFFLRKVKKFKPDLIHLHNLHGSYLNHGMLFRYIKRRNIPVVWTLHDCWSFTGYCPHFTLLNCQKWKTGCLECAYCKEERYPIVDTAAFMWRHKKKWFSGVSKLTIITPSNWLKKMVQESYLNNYPVKVINNGIDLSIFKPVISDFRIRHEIPEGTFLILGVAFDWGLRKGIDVFIQLANRLKDDSSILIVLVGTNERIETDLPSNVLAIRRTENQRELAEIYSAADLFVNPTREDTFPTVNIEALACGTPVLTFLTGGSPEIIDYTCGCAVKCDDVDAMEREIKRIYESHPFNWQDCVQRAQCFNQDILFEEYINLYEDCTCSTKCTI